MTRWDEDTVTVALGEYRNSLAPVQIVSPLLCDVDEAYVTDRPMTEPRYMLIYPDGDETYNLTAEDVTTLIADAPTDTQIRYDGNVYDYDPYQAMSHGERWNAALDLAAQIGHHVRRYGAVPVHLIAETNLLASYMKGAA